MEVSKIHLSSSEMELMQNAEIILTKNRVLEKIRILLEDVQHKQLSFIEETGLITYNEIFKVSPKISRGENYLGLPYLILDYPRQSNEQNFFFIRTMFWWGNFFSCTLHLAKNSKENFEENAKESYSLLKEYSINITDDQWVHHLKESDYRKIGTMTIQEFHNACEKFDHIKIVASHPLSEWERMPSILFDEWKVLLSVCRLIP